jgi:hypothetical protein
MRNQIGALVAALALAQAASALAQEAPSTSAPVAAAPVRHLDRCPGNIADFEGSDATRALVEKCLGRPTRVMPGHGDDVIYQYSAQGGALIIMFVFDHSGALTHFAAYARN